MRRCSIYLLMLLLLLLANLNYAEGLRPHVIHLQEQTAKTMIPLLQPLLIQGATITGRDQTIILKTTLENLHDLQQVIVDLDRVPDLLQISLRRGPPQALSGERTIASTQSKRQRGVQQSLQVSDGGRAEVGLSQEVLVVMGVYDTNFNSAASDITNRLQGLNRRYKKVQSVLVVQPKLLDSQRVKVMIKQQQQRLSTDGNQQLTGDDLQTTLVIPLKTWHLLRSVNQNSQGMGTRQLSTQSRRPMLEDLYIRVDKVQ